MPSSNDKSKIGFNILLKEKEDKHKDKPKANIDNLYEIGEHTRTEEKLYEDDSIILQSILEYSETFGCEKYFESIDLSKNHLLEKCEYYLDLYKGMKSKTRKDVRAAHMDERIVGLLEKLAELELIDIKFCNANNGEQTRKYRFTQLGRLIALLIRLEKVKTTITQSEYIELHKQIYDFYSSLNHVHAKFCLIFFEVCCLEGKFNQIILRLVHLLENADDDKYFFLNEVKFLGLFYQDLEMWDIFKSSLSLLKLHDRPTYHIILLNLKLVIEELQEVKARNLKDFEIMVFEKKQDIDKVVVEGYCNTCNKFFTMCIKIVDYLEYYIDSFVLNQYNDDFKCQNCNKDYLDFQVIVDDNLLIEK